MTDLRIDMLAGHAVVSARMDVSAGTIASALHRLTGALGPQAKARRDRIKERRQAASWQIVRYIGECILSADLQMIDGLYLDDEACQAAIQVSVDILRADHNRDEVDVYSTVSIDHLEDGIVVSEIDFPSVSALDAYCWSDERWNNDAGIDTIAIVRGFIGGQSYVIRLDRLPDEPADPRRHDWMAVFHELVRPSVHDSAKHGRLSGQ